MLGGHIGFFEHSLTNIFCNERPPGFFLVDHCLNENIVLNFAVYSENDVQKRTFLFIGTKDYFKC